MKVSDYIIEFLTSKGVTDIFGYPGGVVCHLMDSALKYDAKISAHVNYHEQASSFAACGYAQAASKVGVAYATSGPGATNLVTGISNAYFDSIPTIFFTGQVDTFAVKDNLKVRQKGFQETNIVEIVKSITKFSKRIDNLDDLESDLEEAYVMATSGRPGPVLLDLPADIQRADIKISNKSNVLSESNVFSDCTSHVNLIETLLKESKRPCFLIGSSVRQRGIRKDLLKIVEKLNIPTVTSMLAVDFLPTEHILNMGFVGVNGHRYANFLLGKSDLVISIGSRLDLKQVGNDRNKFAPNAKLVRIDIDPNELEYKVKDNEFHIVADVKDIVEGLESLTTLKPCSNEWINVCKILKAKLSNIDENNGHRFISKISEKIGSDSVILGDVGHNQVWLAQAFKVKANQSILFSGGLGSMGYSLPAAIGAYYGSKKIVYSFNGDGGFQMNIQELEFISRERIPIKIIIINNSSLGMIRHFQEMNFNRNYIHTTPNSGYSVPDFEAISAAYRLKYTKISTLSELENLEINDHEPSIIEYILDEDTYLLPKFGRDKPNHDQEPAIDRDLYNYLCTL